MANSFGDVDAHGLSTLARGWTPKALRVGQDGVDLMDAFADCLADCLNVLIEAEEYLPLIWDPTRCLDRDVIRTLRLNGIDDRPALTPAQRRRIAVIAASMRAWRGSFRCHRAVAGALTGGPTIIQTYVQQRCVLDESTYDMVLLDDEYANSSLVFVRGQGSLADDYDATTFVTHMGRLAVSAMDELEIVECFAVTAWRDGMSDWQCADGTPAVAKSGIYGEYAGIEIGPGVDADVSTWWVMPSSRASTTDSVWATAWFSTHAASPIGYWRFVVLSNEDHDDAYSVNIPVSSGVAQLLRHTPMGASIVGSWHVDMSSGDGSPHRVDVIVLKDAMKARLRAVIDGNPGPWCTDVAGPWPDGDIVGILLEAATFNNGRLRVVAVTAKEGV